MAVSLAVDSTENILTLDFKRARSKYYSNVSGQVVAVNECLERQQEGPSAEPKGTFPVNIIDIALEQGVSS